MCSIDTDEISSYSHKFQFHFLVSNTTIRSVKVRPGPLLEQALEQATISQMGFYPVVHFREIRRELNVSQ